MRISDWSSDVCYSDLREHGGNRRGSAEHARSQAVQQQADEDAAEKDGLRDVDFRLHVEVQQPEGGERIDEHVQALPIAPQTSDGAVERRRGQKGEPEHGSEPGGEEEETGGANEGNP